MYSYIAKLLKTYLRKQHVLAVGFRIKFNIPVLACSVKSDLELNIVFKK